MLPLVGQIALNNWKPILLGVLLVTCSALLVMGGYRWGVRVEHDRGQQTLTAQVAADVKQCKDAQQITENTSHVYQDQIIALRGQLDNVKRVQPNACVNVRTAKPAPGRNEQTLNTQLPDPNAGVNSDDLFNFAYDAEQVGLQLDACQSFIRAERQ